MRELFAVTLFVTLSLVSDFYSNIMKEHFIIFPTIIIFILTLADILTYLLDKNKALKVKIYLKSILVHFVTLLCIICLSLLLFIAPNFLSFAIKNLIILVLFYDIVNTLTKTETFDNIEKVKSFIYKFFDFLKSLLSNKQKLQ